MISLSQTDQKVWLHFFNTYKAVCCKKKSLVVLKASVITDACNLWKPLVKFKSNHQNCLMIESCSEIKSLELIFFI